jgi:putative membrane protein
MRASIVIALAVAGSVAFTQARGQEVAFASSVDFDVAEVDAPGEVVDFLLTATDARLMNIEEGTMASTNGGSKEIKEYAGKLVNDQLTMLGYIKKMALLRGLILPDRVSEEKREGCDKLAELSGKRFDRKFSKMMIKDRKQDLELFQKAVNSSDDEVRKFAELYIPVLQDHLRRARALKKLV